MHLISWQICNHWLTEHVLFETLLKTYPSILLQDIYDINYSQTLLFLVRPYFLKLNTVSNYGVLCWETLNTATSFAEHNLHLSFTRAFYVFNKTARKVSKFVTLRSFSFLYHTNVFHHGSVQSSMFDYCFAWCCYLIQIFESLLFHSWWSYHDVVQEAGQQGGCLRWLCGGRRRRSLHRFSDKYSPSSWSPDDDYKYCLFPKYLLFCIKIIGSQNILSSSSHN